MATSGRRLFRRVVNDNRNPLAIFQIVLMVGLERPVSICRSILLLTPVISASWSKLRFLRSREEIDPHAVAVVGVSEGGGLGIMLGALSPDVAAVAADAPMLVDFPLSLRSASWPYTEIARYLQKHPRSRTEVVRTLSYFDAVNFAPEVHCPILLSVGLLDRVSLPAAVFGLYNVLPEPKEILTFPDAGHEGGGEDHRAYLLDWLQQTVANRPDS